MQTEIRTKMLIVEGQQMNIQNSYFKPNLKTALYNYLS